MSTKSRERMYGSSIRAAAEQAAAARKEADQLACEAWNKRMLGYQGPAQPSPTIGDAMNAGLGGALGAARIKNATEVACRPGRALRGSAGWAQRVPPRAPARAAG